MQPVLKTTDSAQQITDKETETQSKYLVNDNGWDQKLHLLTLGQCFNLECARCFNNKNDCLKFLKTPLCSKRDKHINEKKLTSCGMRSIGSQD